MVKHCLGTLKLTRYQSKQSPFITFLEQRQKLTRSTWLCEQIIFIHRAKLFSILKNSPFPLAHGIQLHVRDLDLIPCLIPCHRCEKSARESRQTRHFHQATWQHPREIHLHVRGSARIYDVRMAQFVVLWARHFTLTVPPFTQVYSKIYRPLPVQQNKILRGWEVMRLYKRRILLPMFKVFYGLQPQPILDLFTIYFVTFR